MALGKSQEELARECGISGFTISKLERGIIKDPGASTLDRIATALGATSADLLRKPADALPAEVA